MSKILGRTSYEMITQLASSTMSEQDYLDGMAIVIQAISEGRYVAAAVAPEDNTDGDLWYDTATATLRVFKSSLGIFQDIHDQTALGTAIYSAATPPSAPTAGSMWHDTSVLKLKWYSTSNGWQTLYSVGDVLETRAISATPPTSASFNGALFLAEI